ncbi:MAG TPA: hypothetical protein VFQ06_10160, partial [Nitrospira sp.]|nr:hypothetical protein [Nitrospira sp.]
MAREYLISAEAFITLAATVGLFEDGVARRHPRWAAPCRFRLNDLTKRDYAVRRAREADLGRLCELEELCWQHTRTPRERIRARLQNYPQGQFVL